ASPGGSLLVERDGDVFHGPNNNTRNVSFDFLARTEGRPIASCLSSRDSGSFPSLLSARPIDPWHVADIVETLRGGFHVVRRELDAEALYEPVHEVEQRRNGRRRQAVRQWPCARRDSIGSG